jgi:hypothetical protein
MRIGETDALPTGRVAEGKMLKFWKRKHSNPEPPDDDDLLLYMPHYHPADNSLEAHLRCIDIAFKEAVENRAKARRKRFTVVGR